MRVAQSRYKGKFVKKKVSHNKLNLKERNRHRYEKAPHLDLAVSVFSDVGILLIDPKHLAKVRGNPLSAPP